MFTSLVYKYLYINLLHPKTRETENHYNFISSPHAKLYNTNITSATNCRADSNKLDDLTVYRSNLNF